MGRDQEDQMVDALCREFELKGEFLDLKTVKTVYIGGGTPSLLKPSSIQKLFDCFEQKLNMWKLSEVTIEANPEDVSRDFIQRINDLPIGRLSLGVQSFDSKSLKFLGRGHTGLQAEKAIDLIKSFKSLDLNVDLIFGIPDRQFSVLEKDIEILIKHLPSHISAYSLTIEEKTQLGKKLKKGELTPSTDHRYLEEYLTIHERLSQKGFEHYEVSNYAINGHESIHNFNYWRGKSYMGLGPSAHSFFKGRRSWNISNNGKYISDINNGKIPEQSENLTQEDIHNELLMIGLRTKMGIDLQDWSKRFNYDLIEKHSKAIQHYEMAGWVVKNPKHLGLSVEGWFRSDEIVSTLFLEKGELKEKLNDF